MKKYIVSTYDGKVKWGKNDNRWHGEILLRTNSRELAENTVRKINRVLSKSKEEVIDFDFKSAMEYIKDAIDIEGDDWTPDFKDALKALVSGPEIDPNLSKLNELVDEIEGLLKINTLHGNEQNKLRLRKVTKTSQIIAAIKHCEETLKSVM